MTNNESPTPPHRRPLHQQKERDKYFILRNILNIIFMVGAIAGCLIFYYSDHLTGSIVIMGAMAFKFVECALRIFNR